MSLEITMEELRSRQAQESVTPRKERKACEYCNSTSVARRGTGYDDRERGYYCEHCCRECDATGDPTADTIPRAEARGGASA